MAPNCNNSSSLEEEASELLSAVQNHPFLTAGVLFVCVPPLVPAIAYFFPLLAATSLCAVALHSLSTKADEAQREVDGRFRGRRLPEILNPASSTTSRRGSYRILESQEDLIPAAVGARSGGSSWRTRGGSGTAPSGGTWYYASDGGGGESDEELGPDLLLPAFAAMDSPRPAETDASRSRWSNWVKGFEARSSQFVMEEDGHQTPAWRRDQECERRYWKERRYWRSRALRCLSSHRKCMSVDGSVLLVDPLEVIGRHHGVSRTDEVADHESSFPMDSFEGLES